MVVQLYTGCDDSFKESIFMNKYILFKRNSILFFFVAFVFIDLSDK